MTMKSNHFVYNFKAQLAAKCCCGTKSKRDTQQPMLLRCCPQSETWCLK